MIARFASQSEVFSAADPFPSPGPLSAGGGYTSGFNDLLGTTTFTASGVTIEDLVAAVPVTTADMQIRFQTWRLQRAPAAPGYVSCQLNFGSNDFVTSNPGLAAVPAVDDMLSLAGIAWVAGVVLAGVHIQSYPCQPRLERLVGLPLIGHVVDVEMEGVHELITVAP